MSRREVREQIFKMLFQLEFYGEEELDEQLRIFMDGPEASDESDDVSDGLEEMKAAKKADEPEQAKGKTKQQQEYIWQKVNEIRRQLSAIDALINEKATGWKTNRMAKVDLALIRLAVYEMKYDVDIPTGVAINEAVELAKIYSSDGAPSFINGVLAKLV